MYELSENLHTDFAPAERLSDDFILLQAEQIRTQNVVPELYNILPYIVLVLNKQRQIIYSNNALFEMLGLTSHTQVLGFRTGEVMKCVHSDKTPGGCGTTEFCRVCGAVLAILESQKTKEPVIKECLLTAKSGPGTKGLELSVYAVPVNSINEEYTLFVVRDISEEKKKQMLEKVFFHDLLNTSGAVKGYMEIIKKTVNLHEVRKLTDYANEAIDILIDEINSQRDLTAAEKGELKLIKTSFSLRHLVMKLVEFYQNDEALDCSIEFHCEEDVLITSDIVLVRRIVHNMLRNAVEACEGYPIRIWVKRKNDYVEISINNFYYMAKEIQLQIFKRSYSSKGSGRGIGTYSMKILGENYLGGYVSFTSIIEEGTTFVLGLPIERKNH